MVVSTYFQEWTRFFLFFTVNVIAGSVNHIDDTDETYGYYEPLHYGLYGQGMQTWEYSRDFAIRSYAFLTPMWILGSILKAAGFHKVTVFQSIRVFLGMFTAVSQTRFVDSIRIKFGVDSSRYTAWFLLFSPGVFYCSTALLPSAYVMPLLMHSFASYILDDYIHSILWGSIAVLWSGWPFMGAILLPLGLHMVIDRFASGGYISILVFTIEAVLTIAVVGIPSIAIDSWYYGKLTWPAMNIFIYNVSSGCGDELYGVESVSYYVKNLLLNAGVVAFPLAVLAPALHIAAYLLRLPVAKSYSKAVTLEVSLALWLVLLFRRPHKEERFLYPIYPLICFVAALCVETSARMISTSGYEDKYNKRLDLAAVFKHLSVGGILIASLLFGLSRTTSNYRNFSGYMAAWRDLQQHISASQSVCGRTDTSTNVCVGGEWYQFPSHFLMPANTRLVFVNDTFHGLLPRYFAPEFGEESACTFDFTFPFLHGTRAHTWDLFNDKNREDPRRYVSIQSCDYIVLSVSNGTGNDDSPLRNFIRKGTNTISAGKISAPRLVISRDVIDSDASHSVFTRAFYVPVLSDRNNVYKKYAVYALSDHSCN